MVEGHNVWRHCTEQFLRRIQWNRLYWGRHLQEFHFHELTVSLKLFIRVVFNWKLKVRAGFCTSHCIVVRLIDCVLFCVPFKNFSLIKRHQGQKKLGFNLTLMTFVQREVLYIPWPMVFAQFICLLSHWWLCSSHCLHQIKSCLKRIWKCFL